VLTFLWLKSFAPGKKRQQPRTFLALILAGLVLFAVSDEFHQSFVPGRSASVMDVGLDLLGILFALSVYLLFLKRKYRRVLIGNRPSYFRATGNSQDLDNKE